ncbi:MAG: riboflavin biosynthesis protein RibF [Chloroflexota bacterium]|nr:riboflavin biosynthesis protein RibF [Chloroflexota bacterium]
MIRAETALGLDALPRLGPVALTMGVFDGVHRGHQAVLAQLVDGAAAAEVTSVALVFEPHPDEVLRPGVRVPRLAPTARSRAWIGDCGVDWAPLVRFDDELRALSAEAFIAHLAPAVELQILVMCEGTAFGRGRGGTVPRMRELGRENGFSVLTVPPLVVEGAPLSSTRIRGLIAAGDLAAAAALLGRPAFLEGRVVSGDRRGRGLGFPTANLAFDYLPALAPLGIYLGEVSVSERGVGPRHPALVSIGVRPTFHAQGATLVEVYLLDWDGDLYGTRLQLSLLRRIREERRFADADALVAQMRLDEEEARRLLAGD